MRTKQEVNEALECIGLTLEAYKIGLLPQANYRAACKVYEVLAWFLKLEKGDDFAAMLADVKQIQADARRSIQ